MIFFNPYYAVPPLQSMVSIGRALASGIEPSKASYRAILVSFGSEEIIIIHGYRTGRQSYFVRCYDSRDQCTSYRYVIKAGSPSIFTITAL